MIFEDYDRIADLVMYFDNNVVLEFIVSLSSKDKYGNRIFFHSEFDYNSDKFSGVDKGHSIKRRMSFYYAINDKRAFNRSITLRPEDVIMLSMIIKNNIFPWYFGSNNKRNIYSIIENKLCITGKYTEVIYSKSEYAYLKFIPIVYTFNDGTYKEGIRMYVSCSEEFVDMEIDKFMGFYYYLSRVDMYSAAASLAAYVKSPPYGINNFNGTGIGSRVKKANDPDIFTTSNNQPYIEGPKREEINNFFANAKAVKRSERLAKEANVKHRKKKSDNDDNKENSE